MSHLGRPNGEVNPNYRWQPVAAKLEELLNVPVTFLKTRWRRVLRQRVQN